MAEQLTRKDTQLIELAGQLAGQNQRVADQNQKITNQEGEIFILKRQIEEKDQQLARANKEVRYLLARDTQREEPLLTGKDRVVGATGSGVAESVQGEVTTLRDEMERLKGLINQLIDKDSKMPNNMS